MNELMSLSNALAALSLPMGDDTPVMLYVLLGCGALVLLIAVTALGKVSASKKQKAKKKRKRPPVNRQQ